MALCVEVSVCWGRYNLQVLFHTDSASKSDNTTFTEAVEPIHHTDHVDVPVSTTAPETTSSSEPEPSPEETTAALETANED